MLVFGVIAANRPRKLSGSGLAGWPQFESFDVDHSKFFQTLASTTLRLVPETLLVPIRLHALAALMLGNFRFASFLK